MDNVKLTMDNCGIAVGDDFKNEKAKKFSPRNFKSIAEGNTIIVNCALSIVNYSTGGYNEDWAWV